MEIQDFFEKNNKLQFNLLLLLGTKNHLVRKDYLISTLNISSFVLEKCVMELRDLLHFSQMDMEICEHYSTNSLSLKNYNQTDFEKIFYYFATSSTDYSIILYVYSNRNFYIQKLSTHLSLSIASTYRYISKLNKKLKEFHLTIKNGRIHGDDLQLCYFYYQFFWYSLPPSHSKRKIFDFNLVQFVELLETKLSIQLTESSRRRILLWCKILKDSISNDVIVSKTTLDLVDEIQTDPFYKIVKEAYLLSQSYSALLESEYIATYIYVFLLFAFPTDYCFYNTAPTEFRNWPTQIHNVVELNEHFIDTVCSSFYFDKNKVYLALDINQKYMLSSMHVGIIYFHGQIDYYTSIDLLNRANENITYPVLIQKLVNHLESKVTCPLMGATQMYIIWVYHNLIESILEDIYPEILIGVNLNSTPLLATAYVDSLKKIYEHRSYVTVELATLDQFYDIFISDDSDSNHDFIFDLHFLTQEIENDYNIPLKELLNKRLRRLK